MPECQKFSKADINTGIISIGSISDVARAMKIDGSKALTPPSRFNPVIKKNIKTIFRFAVCV